LSIFREIYASWLEKKTEIELKKGEMRRKRKKTGFYPQEKKRKKTGIFRFFPFFSEIFKH